MTTCNNANNREVGEQSDGNRQPAAYHDDALTPSKDRMTMLSAKTNKEESLKQ